MEWFLLLVPSAFACGLLYVLSGFLERKTGIAWPKRYLSQAFFGVAAVFFFIAMIPFAILAFCFNPRIGFERPLTNATRLKRAPDGQARNRE